VTYQDEATGISFEAPSGLFFTKAEPAFDGQTTQAILTTYADVNRVTDMRNELRLTARIATRGTNEDLRALAARGFPGYPPVMALPGGGLLLDGSGQAGPRKFALFERGPRHVLILDAFPSDSRRIGIFDGVLASLRQR
jgi:hypothetical protein